MSKDLHSFNKSFAPHPVLHPLDEQLQAGLRGDFKRGFEIADYLEKTSPQDPRAAFNRAWYKMMEGKLLEGLSLLDAGRWIKVFGGQPLPTNKSIYKDEDLKNKSLLICGEGGLGDEIINVRFAEEFAQKGAKVVVACDSSLTSVFSRVPGVSAAINHRAAVDVYHDFWVPAMSAARVLSKEYKTLSGKAYLSAHPDYKKKWRDYFINQNTFKAGDLKIGLRFYGNPKFEHEQHRKFPPQDLINVLGDRPWINLQKEESDLKLETWEDTLAVLAHLDLVITSCTSVAHASAALGKKTWVIVPLLPYYIWALPGATSPWYGSVRLFRQSRFGDWSNVFTEIEKALKEENT